LSFCSYEFFAFLCITFFIYYLPFLKQFQPIVLLVASLCFYAYSEPKYISVMFLSALLSSSISYSFRANWNRKRLLWVGVAVNLLALVFFKYSGFIYENLGAYSFVQDQLKFLSTIPLPIGISFYTFHNMSLMIDSYYASKRKAYVGEPPKTHFRNTMLYTVFFPQLIAGPIVKWNTFGPQIGSKDLKSIDWLYCTRSLIIGYFLKLFVADNLADSTIWFKYPYFLEKSRVTLWLSLFSYSAQIFADFAGYSLIALGLAGLFGYRLPVNFNAPYISRSPSEFWSRWHITLSQWLRQYLFNPLALNAKRKGRMGVSAFLAVMLLGGLWHGASWNFIIWGFCHGVLLTISYFYSVKVKSHMSSWLAIPLMFLCVSFTWVFFALTKFEHSIAFIRAMGLNNFGILDYGTYFYICLYSLPVVLLHLIALLRERGRKLQFLNYLEPLILGLALFLILTNSGGGHNFVYFQF
jgi:alginate O-acetyltransferase complex protein AlgI